MKDGERVQGEGGLLWFQISHGHEDGLGLNHEDCIADISQVVIQVGVYLEGGQFTLVSELSIGASPYNNDCLVSLIPLSVMGQNLY